MTPDDPDDLHGALARLFEAVGWARAAEIAGKSESLLRKWADPQASANHAPLEACLEIELAGLQALRFSPETAPLSGMWRRRLQAATNQEQALKAVMHELHDVTRSAARVTAVVDAAIADNYLSSEEKRAIRRVVDDLRREIDDLVRSLDTSSPLPVAPQ